MSDIISVLSFFTALIAAGFAMRSAEQARRANELNLVNEKIKIFEAVNTLHTHLQICGTRFDVMQANVLSAVAVRAKLILNDRLVEQFSSYHSKVVELAALALNYDQDPEGYRQLLAASVDVSIRGKKLTAALESDLRKQTQDSWRPS